MLARIGLLVTMNFQLSVIGVMAFGAIAASCQSRQDNPSREADLAALEKLVEAEAAAGTSGDVEELMNLRTADAIEMLPGEPTLVGKDAIRTAWGEDDPFVSQFSNISIEEVRVFGEWGYMRITYVQTLTPVTGGESIEFNGRTLWLVQRQPDNSWKIALEMINSLGGE